tara:strand:- start:1251 stop:1433 length:183 start_codon:yes stop_codon:yes gene_type:complete
MKRLRYLALDTATVDALRAGGPDSNGQTHERLASDGGFPDALTNSPDFILHGYDHDNRIV